MKKYQTELKLEVVKSFLAGEGMAEPVNHKCVQRLMQKMGLRALIRAKKRSRPVPGINDAHVPNVLERAFCAAAPNQKWETDVTEFNLTSSPT